MPSFQRKYNTYRLTFPEFVYDSYRYDVQPEGLHISFRFLLGDKIVFTPSAFIPARPFLCFNLPRRQMDAYVFSIGMIELISYWKCCCPPRVIVRCGRLDESQVAFWKKIYFLGLGEFFYTNGIKATEADFMTLVSAEEAPLLSPLAEEASDSHPCVTDYLVPIGGGKDSAVTLSLLKPHHRVVPLIMNPRGATIGTIEVAGYTLDDALVIQRRLDPTMLDLNAKGCLNGHTPFSALLAFYTLLGSALSGIPNVALSNERSASQPTVLGTQVNHQYSKSFEFEEDYRTYVRRNLSCTYNYFSFLRPISELSIALLFSKQCADYHRVFRSCNVGSKQDVWCSHCAKCLFVYIILSPFLTQPQLEAIFGRNLLDDESLRHEFDQLVGEADTKPFECVGTVEEVRAALSLLVRQYDPAAPLPLLLRNFSVVPFEASLLQPLASQHNLSAENYTLLSETLNSLAENYVR